MFLKRGRLVVHLMLGFLAAVGATDALASKFSATGRTAQASWVQENGCIRTSVFVSGSERTVLEAGAGGPVDLPTTLMAFIDTTDLCSGTFTSATARGEGELTMTNVLNEARLRGTLAARIFAGGTSTPAEVVVDVTLTGVGDVGRNFSVFMSFTPGTTSRFRGQGASRLREADAAGSVRLNGVEALPGPSSSGFLLIETTAEVTRF